MPGQAEVLTAPTRTTRPRCVTGDAALFSESRRDRGMALSLAVSAQRGTGGFKCLQGLVAELGVLRVDGFKALDDGRGDDEAGEPFVVCGHHIPRRNLGCGGADQRLIGLDIGVPQLALLDVASVELPSLVRGRRCGQEGASSARPVTNAGRISAARFRYAPNGARRR